MEVQQQQLTEVSPAIQQQQSQEPAQQGASGEREPAKRTEKPGKAAKTAYRDAELSLRGLTAAQRDEWLRSGELPEASEPAKTPEPEGDAINLRKLTDSEYSHWRKTGELPQKKEVVKEESEPTPERRPDDRVWTKKLDDADLKAYIGDLNEHVGKATEHVSQHAQRQDIEAGLNGMFRGIDQQMHWDFLRALNEIPNPGEVLAHIGLSQADRETLVRSPNWRVLRDSVQKLSKALKPEKRITSAKGPTHEVSAIGTGPTDQIKDALDSDDFGRFRRLANARDIKQAYGDSRRRR